MVTGKSLGSLVQISKGYDSYLDERGRWKAKKIANIGIYRLFQRMCVSFGVAIICLCKPCFAGRVGGSRSVSRDWEGVENFFFFYSKLCKV